MSWQDCDHTQLDLLATVAGELATVTAADQIMLVGARCRDLHHWRYGCEQLPLRRTIDVDVAIALPDQQAYHAIANAFPSLGTTGHSFSIAGVRTDVIAFDGIEDPPGTTPHSRGGLNVHGFRDAYRHAESLPLPGGLVIRIPRVEGYAVLKTHAWLDRSQGYDTKDGPDLAIAVHWCAQDLDRLYHDDNRWALELHDFDIRRAAAALLGVDMRESLNPRERAVLAERLAAADHDRLAAHFTVAAPGWPDTGTGRQALVAALFPMQTIGS